LDPWRGGKQSVKEIARSVRFHFSRDLSEHLNPKLTHCYPPPTHRHIHVKVVELQKALEQERQLRGLLSKHVKDTNQAVADAAAAQAMQARILEQASAIQVICVCKLNSRERCGSGGGDSGGGGLRGER
jgi:hypothetical protein